MRRVALALAALLLAVNGFAQARGAFTGVWVLDTTGATARDVYGEIRVVRQSDEDVRVAMIDFGTAWLDGRFQDVVRVLPWTFRVGEWAPRRGGPASGQPRARARWTSAGLRLEKSTDRGNADFRRLWNASPDGQVLIERYDSRDELRFLRWTAVPDSIPAGGISVAPSPDLSKLFVSCPIMECRVVELYSGRQTGVTPLRSGTQVSYSIDAELRIEPASLAP